MDIESIERVFPNKVIINIKQRLPVAAISVDGGGYALADIDFQLDKIVGETEVDFSCLIAAPYLSVSDTFNTPPMKRFREGLLAVKSAGFLLTVKLFE